jgi:hypothetical protein
VDGPDPLFTDDAGRPVPIRVTPSDFASPARAQSSLATLVRRWWPALLFAAIITALAAPHVARAFSLPRELAAILCLVFLVVVRIAPHQARGLIAAAGPLTVALALILRGGFRASDWDWWLFGALALWLFVTFLRIAASRTPAEPGPRDELIPRVAGALLAGRCASCAYDLEGILRVDGLTRCPECAAAWRLDAWRDQFPTPRVPTLHPSRERTRYLVATARDDAYGLPITAPLLAARPAAEVAQRLRANRRGSNWLTWAFVALVVMFAIVLLAGVGTYNWRAAVPLLAILVVILAIVGAGVLAARRASLAKAHEAILADLLSADRCPCCEATLPTERTSIDAVRLCPSCGHGWHAQGATHDTEPQSNPGAP